jgi:hypothetical protein
MLFVSGVAGPAVGLGGGGSQNFSAVTALGGARYRMCVAGDYHTVCLMQSEGVCVCVF